MTDDDTIPDDEHALDGCRCRYIVNPVSGTGDHVEEVYSRVDESTVTETEDEGDAIALAKEAATDDVQLLVACGGDGTIHEVVCGLDRADALSDVTVAVVPGGTGNNFARNIGVRSIEQAFELLETGERRRIDVGVANSEPFVNSCIAGLTAKTSSETDSELKEQFGTLAYIITGLRQAADFDPLHVEIDIDSNSNSDSDANKTPAESWAGEALCICIGNARRFADGRQASVEDGLFDVTIVEEMPTNEMLTEAATQRLFGSAEHVTHFTSEYLEITSQQERDIAFSLDGEMSTHQQLPLRVRPQELKTVVGPEYSPEPAE